jgi:protein SCO1/2
MGKEIVFYSISIDPENDTPKVLKAYADKFDVGPGWLFLTGNKEDIKLLTKKLGLSRNNDAANKDGHLSSLMLGNEPAGQWMRQSAVDNPRFLAASMGNFFGWKDTAPASDYSAAKPVAISQAEFLFQSRCASCHSIGGGDRIGPDLMGVTQRREHAWLARFVQDPDKMLAQNDPIARQLFDKYKQVRMPNLRLADEEVSALLAYLDQRSRQEPASASAAAATQADAHAHHHHH